MAGEEDKQSSVKRVAVVGAGVSGLAAAYKLKLHGLNVTIFEAEGRAGGKLQSISHDGLIWDEGANTMTESETEVRCLLDNLGLREKQQFPILQNKRYIVRNGTPVLLPSNPIALITSNFLSVQSKFQIFLEPFLWKKSNLSKVSDTQESVGGFFQRHFGKEVVEYLIDPFVAGTSAGDPESLSMCHAFPELWDLEKRFGSIILGAFRSKLSARKEKSGGMRDPPANKKRQRGSFSFLGGMQTLTDTLCGELGKDELKFQSKVLGLSYRCDENSPLTNWSVSISPDHKKHSQEKSFDAVIMTAPLCNVKEMKVTKSGSPFLLDFLPEVSYLPLSVIITTFKKENVKRPLEGFGVLIPSKEQQYGFKSLGTLFSSVMFPDRAPSDLYLYTTFVGGSRNRELAKASTDELKRVVTSDLRQLLGAEGEPTFVNHFYWSKAFPLYGRNYDSVIKAIEKMEENLPGFFYAGNHKGGLSVGKAIASGCRAADLVISYIDSSLVEDKICR
ncbi:protoporphyrinogen oxidase, mitochondrial [Cornus florida]|uniref:protoporphyrinogen oxidase, mitochondrial n=1 Tax=Cornus florida TaxID=4283 RepID=UPI0028963548|nr:protoporphyrinogen oxidase, mitochondrial [Cornus florida]